MREILFRGKRVDNGEWVYGDLLHDGYDYDVAIWERETKLVTEVVGSTVGLYTGLKDKNGNRIFEGDIVFAKDDILGSPFADGIKGKVAYCETAFFIEPKNVMDTEWLFNECAVYEIIGNIHDNPELLKEAPTIDAVPVVRCKECKYQEDCIGRIQFWGRNPVLELNTTEYHPLDFCSYGERKDDGICKED